MLDLRRRASAELDGADLVGEQPACPRKPGLREGRTIRVSMEALGGGRTLPQTVVECDGRPNGATLNRRRRRKFRRRDNRPAETELSSVFHTIVLAPTTSDPGQASFSPKPGHRYHTRTRLSGESLRSKGEHGGWYRKAQGGAGEGPVDV